MLRPLLLHRLLSPHQHLRPHDEFSKTSWQRRHRPGLRVDQESTHSMSWGKLSVVHTQQALPKQASDICLQSSSLPTACPWHSPGKNTGVGCHFLLQCMKGKSESEVAQSCPTLHNPMVCSLPGSSVHGIFQARVLEWGAIAFSNN